MSCSNSLACTPSPMILPLPLNPLGSTSRLPTSTFQHIPNRSHTSSCHLPFSAINITTSPCHLIFSFPLSAYPQFQLPHVFHRPRRSSSDASTKRVTPLF